MSLTVKINGQDNSLAHKGCSGFAKSTLPDVCKTPSPGGPVPIPYPIIVSTASDLAKGTTTVKADGGNMVAIKGSELSRCSGDEAGTAGGLKSSTNMKEASWILYAFTVKMEGKNVCRLGDKLFMNHGNTVCLGGWQALPVIPQELDADDAIACAIMCCDEVPYRQTKGTSPKKDCQRLASKKHSCVHHALKMRNHPDVESSPRFTDKSDRFTASKALLDQAAKMRKKAEVSCLTPDTLIKSDPPRLIDAKFIPCASRSDINNDLNRKDGRIIMNGAQTLRTGTGPIAGGKKEQLLYRQLCFDKKKIDPGPNGVRTMTPEDAQNWLGPDSPCDCADKKAGTKEKLPY